MASYKGLMFVEQQHKDTEADIQIDLCDSLSHVPIVFFFVTWPHRPKQFQPSHLDGFLILKLLCGAVTGSAMKCMHRHASDAFLQMEPIAVPLGSLRRRKDHGRERAS